MVHSALPQHRDRHGPACNPEHATLSMQIREGLPRSGSTKSCRTRAPVPSRSPQKPQNPATEAASILQATSNRSHKQARAAVQGRMTMVAYWRGLSPLFAALLVFTAGTAHCRTLHQKGDDFVSRDAPTGAQHESAQCHSPTLAWLFFGLSNCRAEIMRMLRETVCLQMRSTKHLLPARHM
jgi:hypothetical protein